MAAQLSKVCKFTLPEEKWSDTEKRNVSQTSPTALPLAPASTDSELCSLSELAPAERQLYQKALLQMYRSRDSRSNANVKHLYDTQVQTINSSTSFATQINDPVAGTGIDRRTGDAIYNHGVTIRMSLRFIPTASIATTAAWTPSYRIILIREHIPQGGALVENPGSNPPVSPDTAYSNLGASNLLVPTFVRNPNSYDNWHVFHDKTYHMPNQLTYAGAAGQYMQTGFAEHTFHFDLHKSKTVFWDANGGAVSENLIYFYVLTDAVTAQVPIQVQYTKDYTFSDAPQT